MTRPTDRRAAAAKSPLDHDPEAVTWARKSVGWTQAALAQEVGISPGHMSEIEAGTRNARPDLLNRIAKALNCPRSVLERKRPEHCDSKAGAA
jgi:transcriptional regulator with XRE-family HTH domain